MLNRAKLAYNSVAAWLDGTAPAPPRLAAVPGLDEQLRIQDRVAQAMKALRHQHGALSLETIEARAVFDGDALADLRPDEKNRAKELIEDFMIAANGVTARYLEQQGFPVAAPRPALARALGAHRRAGRATLGEHLPPSPTPRALEEFLATRAARPIPRASPTSRSPSSSCWARASTRSSFPANERTGTSASP